MINSMWLLLLPPAFAAGVFLGGFLIENFYTKNSGNARLALKRAEAYETYRKEIGK